MVSASAACAVLVDVDVVVERAAERGRVAPLLARHAPGCARTGRRNSVGRQLVGHPAVGVARHAAQAALDDGVGRAGAALPGEPGRVGRDPDRARLLDRARLERDARRTDRSGRRGCAPSSRRRACAGWRCLPPAARRARRRRCPSPRARRPARRWRCRDRPGRRRASARPLGEHVEARPLLGEHHGMAVDERRHAADGQPHARA